jgi:hypothetical protein
VLLPRESCVTETSKRKHRLTIAAIFGDEWCSRAPLNSLRSTKVSKPAPTAYSNGEGEWDWIGRHRIPVDDRDGADGLANLGEEE